MAPYVKHGVGITTKGHEANTSFSTVQGCDRGTFSSDCGPWSISIDMII